jgi:hypothetical protein
MARSPEKPPKANLSAANSSRSLCSVDPAASGAPRAPDSGERLSEDAARRLHGLIQGAEVNALVSERARLEPSDFGDLEDLPLAQLLVFLSGTGNDENDLLLELLTGLEDDLERAHHAATNEEHGGELAIDWPKMLRPIRARARVARELRRRQARAEEMKRWDVADGASADAKAIFEDGHDRLCEMLMNLDGGARPDVAALRPAYNLARAAVATTPPNVDARELANARGIAVEVGRRLDRLQGREHEHAEDVALLASVPVLARGAA